MAALDLYSGGGGKPIPNGRLPQGNGTEVQSEGAHNDGKKLEEDTGGDSELRISELLSEYMRVAAVMIDRALG